MDIDRRPKRMQLMTGPGSGKTTLARQLSSRLNVPCYNLAHIAYKNGAGRKIVLEERVESLRRIIVQPGWITEAAFLWWTEPFPKSLGHGFALTQETMQTNLNLWLWLVPYILLLLFMVYAMMEFTVSLLIKHPAHNRRPITVTELRARILALLVKQFPDDQIESSTNTLEFRWQESTESNERFAKAKRSTIYRLHILLDEERHELCICESSSSSMYFVGLYQWLPRLSAFAGYSAGPPGMTPNVQQIMAATLKSGWIFRPVILPYQTTERGARFLRGLTPPPLRVRSSTLFWGILYPASFFLAFAWLFALGGPELRTPHNFLILLLLSVVWWAIWGLIAWGICGFPQFWRHQG